MRNRTTIALLIGFFISFQLFAQDEIKKENDLVNHTELEYEILYDEPDSINKLFVTLYPLSAELFATNTSLGFGGQIHYLHKKKWDAYINAKKSYTTTFDIQLASGEKRSTVDNKLLNFRYFEGIFNYHVIDETKIGKAKITPYKGGINRRIHQSSVTTNIKVPAHVRKIIGIRGGAYAWGSTVNVGPIAEEQKVLILSPDRSDTLRNDDNLFSTFNSEGFSLGASYSTIKNIFVQPYGYDPVTNDHIFTAYFDILFAPFMNLDPLFKNDIIFSLDEIKRNKVGFRTGIQGMFNRTWGWSYNIETGLRPSISKRKFYFALKVGLSIGSHLRLKRKAYIMH